MGTSDWKNLLRQVEHKPALVKRFLKYNKPKDRKYGLSKKPCVRCGRIGAHVGAYGLNLCRQCFREIAVELGFKKYQ